MPTNEWFQKNPKVSAYISTTLNQQLEEWMESRGIGKVSQALTQILEEHLGVVQSVTNQPTINSERIEALEGK